PPPAGGGGPQPAPRPAAAPRAGILPVARAAAQAAAEGGTEVSPARGRWALLKHRKRRRLPGYAEPAARRRAQPRTVHGLRSPQPPAPGFRPSDN
ncbi:hypothetical protein AB0A70_30150, partial [Streptomyces morookaense]